MTGPPLPLVGRAAELDGLLSAHAAVAAGAGRLVLLSAEAGGGKIRLVDEFLARLAPGTAYGVGGAVDLGDQSSPLLPLRLALADLHRNTAGSPPTEAVPLSSPDLSMGVGIRRQSVAGRADQGQRSCSETAIEGRQAQPGRGLAFATRRRGVRRRSATLGRGRRGLPGRRHG